AQNFAAGNAPVSVAVGDFNGDGRLDVAVGLLDFGTFRYFSILLGNGDGSFQAPRYPTAGGGAVFVAVGDFNSDGQLDLAVASSPQNQVSVLLGNGDGTFRLPRNMSLSGPSSIAVGDFNGDGWLDLAVVSGVTGNVSVFLGNGDGSFQAARNFAASQSQ